MRPRVDRSSPSMRDMPRRMEAESGPYVLALPAACGGAPARAWQARAERGRGAA